MKKCEIHRGRISPKCVNSSVSAAKILMAVALAFLVFLGCRRTDVRDYTLTLPGLTEQNKAKVVEALAKYNGIQKDSYRFDFAKKTLTLKYDSMQIAKTNIRMAIQEKGLAVKLP